MNRYVSLRFRKLPTVCWHLEPQLELAPGQKVIAKTVHGQEVGTVLSVLPENTEPRTPTEPFVRDILRVVTDEDRTTLQEICRREREAFLRSRELTIQHKLEMKMLKAEYFFDQSRLILYYKSDLKVDFRDLLKSLAGAFRTRIELRQIGVRDETKLLGGLGCCGKEVCCAQFMRQFTQVSTKMAKDQNLSLNPVKLSGICGRLLCCLGHEYEYYASFHGKFPKIGAEIVVGAEKGRVLDLNYITRTLLIGYWDRRKVTVTLDIVKGRKDPATGRNMWWVQEEGQPEPDLSILFQQFVPPPARSRGKDRPPRDGKPGDPPRAARETPGREPSRASPDAADSAPEADLTDASVPADSVSDLEKIDGVAPARPSRPERRNDQQPRGPGGRPDRGPSRQGEPRPRRDQEQRPRNERPDRDRRPGGPSRDSQSQNQHPRSGQGQGQNRWNSRQGGGAPSQTPPAAGPTAAPAAPAPTPNLPPADGGPKNDEA